MCDGCSPCPHSRRNWRYEGIMLGRGERVNDLQVKRSVSAFSCRTRVGCRIPATVICHNGHVSSTEAACIASYREEREWKFPRDPAIGATARVARTAAIAAGPERLSPKGTFTGTRHSPVVRLVWAPRSHDARPVLARGSFRAAPIEIFMTPINSSQSLRSFQL